MKDNDVRPQRFDDFVGQKDVLDVIRRAVAAAKASGRPCGHLLLAGLPGCGKTSLAAIVAREMGTRLKQAVCTAIEHRGELSALLTDLGPRDILFLDEIHALDKKLQEGLYTAAEDGVVDLVAGKRMIRLPLKPFTLIGATTRAHMLTGPLRDRFAYTFQLKHYTVPELARIARSTMARLRVPTNAFADNVADAIGRRSRGTPRIANRLVRACRDFMESGGSSELSLEVAETTFRALGIDSVGLDATDRAYLQVLMERAAPMGVEAISAQLGQERASIETLVEPLLLEVGFVRRTPQGRVITQEAIVHLTRVEAEQHVVDVTDDAELMS